MSTRGYVEAGDIELVDAARSGSEAAVVELWQRHYPVTLSAARRVTRQHRDAEELASDAFARMLAAMAAGGGPTTSVRAYLMTSVRNLAVSRGRHSSSGEVLTDKDSTLEHLASDGTDPVARHGELSLMRQAFATLPKRWQEVLWRTAVDHESNIEVGAQLGLSPNAVAALARRARRGLRTAYLQAHLSNHGIDAGCEPYVRGLATMASDPQSASPALREHVEGCLKCQARLAELAGVEAHLGSVLGPAVLGLVGRSPLLAPAAATGGAHATGSGAGQPTGSVLGVPAKAAAGVLAVGSAAAVAIVMAMPFQPATRDVAALETEAHTSGRSAPTSAPRASAVPTTAAPPTAAPPTAAPPTPAPLRASTHPPSPSPTTARPRPATLTRPRPTTLTRPRPTTAPAPSTPPTPRPTTTAVPSPGPVAVHLALSGTSTTTVSVDVTAAGTTGPVRLRLKVPHGVVITGASGQWQGCTQSGRVIECQAEARPDGHWTGQVTMAWPPGTRGRVSAQVDGRYADGSAASGAIATAWHP